VVDWLSLVGDSVDNIPGVPGVGAKTAARLLVQFGTLDALFERLAEVEPERVRIALASAASDVRRNRALILLRADLPIGRDLEQLRPGPVKKEERQRLLEGWGFRTLLAQERVAEPQQELPL
jgi:DNA polymerase I